MKTKREIYDKSIIQGQVRFKVNSTTISPATALESLLVFINVHRKDSQAHGYHCSFYPEVLNIVSIEKRVSATKSMLNP
jgi:hypothetical protein